ncbi:AAA family ATPase [Luteimonas granuli]|uniref:AAA family ATPase n=1 Tax=Luteimonas granuli TaxID=1176533 RepID=A0A518N2H7_9GAMM|nr:ATP-binding protein [Luteimonas granuli]QDW66102.1 AAA family ATPase [Luteimonas granuli]
MRVRKIKLTQFKRFDDLTIDLGDDPRKLVALVGPNGCGKSSVFDAFEIQMKNYRSRGNEDHDYFSKSKFSIDESLRNTPYNQHQAVQIETTTNAFGIKSFYIRTAYRFTSKIKVDHIAQVPGILEHRDEPISTIALDTRLESNYKRLLGTAYSEFFRGEKAGSEVKDQLIGKINAILNKIIDVEISDLGDILNGRGQLYFKKGNSHNFPYANLSSGEKEVIDIIVDLLVKIPEYDESVFCIDEPELHLNTAIQRKLLVEIEKLIPENCQLWVATHSIGFLRAMQEELAHKSQILDFSEKEYFSGSHVIMPIAPNRTNWQRIFSTALEDLTGLVSPRVIVYCEGRDLPGASGNERGLDARVYNTVFSSARPDTLFISSGGNTELDQRSDIAIRILGKVFTDLSILVLKDRDVASGARATMRDREIYLQNNPPNHRVLNRFEIENYLFDKEVLAKYCAATGTEFDERAYDSFVTDIVNQNVKDEIGRIKAACGISTSINAEVFKLKLAVHITPDTQVFSELEQSVFNRE